MTLDFLDPEECYTALVERDAAYEGRVYVGVKSTGIFCRMTCPARKPKQENCIFYASISECLAADFRPCKRCYPLRPAAEGDPSVGPLLKALEAEPGRRWREGDIAAMGVDPSTARRAFKRHFGMTFLELARMTRLRHGFEKLGAGGSVIEAQLEAGFESASGFRAAFAKLLGVAPASLKSEGLLLADWINTPLGDMIAISDQHHLHLLEFVDRKGLPAELKKLVESSKGDIGIGRYGPTDQIREELAAYFDGRSADFKTPLTLAGTPFTKSVWEALRRIPAGETRSYADLAISIDNPAAVRAVARANGANQLAIIVPCHRVIGKDGSMTGYAGGLWRKQKLIELERQYQKSPS